MPDRNSPSPVDQTVTRRRMLTALGGLGIAAGVAACTGSAASSRPTAATSSPGGAPSASGSVGEPTEPGQLRIPPLLAPRTDAHGRKVFDLTVETGTSTFLPGTSTATWGVNGGYLGPTLRISRGDYVRMHVRNQLPSM